MRSYFELWARVLLERDQPELVRLRRPDGIRMPETGGRLRVVHWELLNTVRELSRLKTGVAVETTDAMLRQVERDLAR